LFPPNEQDSAALGRSTFFVADDRVRPLWRIVLFAFAVITLSLVLWTIYMIAAGGLVHEPSALTEETSGEISLAIAALIVGWSLRRYVDRRSFSSLGFALRGPWLALALTGVVFGAGMQAIAFAVEEIAGSTRVVAFGPARTDVEIVAASAALFAVVAFFEEFCFRGYVLQNLWEGFGVWPAVIVTSVLFAGVHLYNPNIATHAVQAWIGIFAYALWACCSLVWTKSLWLAFGTHLGWNLFEGPVFGFPVSGLAMPFRTVIAQTASGPVWLTGGSFGPEAGVSSLVALALGLVVLRCLYAKGAFARVADLRESYAR
jgi:membrane protease YdiL (CAAX protease family)